MKKKFFTICAIVFLGFTGCTHRESANIDLTTSSVGVIETSGNSKKSRIYFYNQNLEKTATLPLEYACLLYTSPSPRDAHESRMPSSA